MQVSLKLDCVVEVYAILGLTDEKLADQWSQVHEDQQLANLFCR